MYIKYNKIKYIKKQTEDLYFELFQIQIIQKIFFYEKL